MKHPPDALPQQADTTLGAAYYSALAERQYLQPLLPLRTALLQFTEARRMPMVVVDQTLRTLKLDSRTALGRLSRTQLIQLATTLCQVRQSVRIRACAG